MKYAPLVWAALWRKPAETLLTWLAVTAAFTLFGLMIGLNATRRHFIETARVDRLSVNQRFSNPPYNGLPIAIKAELERMEGVAAAGAFHGLSGYYGDKTRRAYVYAVDEGMRQGWSELPVTPEQWSQLFANPSGVILSRNAARRLGLKTGDTLPLTARPGERADGGTAWTFQVLGLAGDDPEWGAGGFVLGNVHFLDNQRPPAMRGQGYGFRVALRDGAASGQVARNIDRHFRNSATPTISVSAKVNAQALVNGDGDSASMTWSVAGAGLFMVLFLTANGISQSVRERIPELAVLQTIGFRPSHLIAMVFVEAAIPTVLGAVLGSVLAAVLTRWPFHSLPPALAKVFTGATLTPAVLCSALAFALLIAVVGSVVPAVKLRRLSVTDALARR